MGTLTKIIEPHRLDIAAKMQGNCISDALKSHSGLQNPPRCLVCWKTTRRETVKNPNNPNGNYRRPYFICNCGQFSCFGDMRGIWAVNPVCDCPELWHSRLQVAGANDNKLVPRALHYRCAVGGCRFFSYLTSSDGKIITLQTINLNLNADDMVQIGL
jgi:hypothetical protein